MVAAVLLAFASSARLASGILTISDPSVAVGPAAAEEFAAAALEAARAYGVDPWELIAVARNESSFRVDDLGPDGKDCGIMQTRVTVTRYSCKRLRSDYRIAFAEGARELAGFRASCRARPDFDRCRLNRYNSGIRYARKGFHGRYWLRVLCFTEAARAGAPGGGCTNVTSRRAIAAALRQFPPNARHSTLFAAAEARARTMH